MCSIAFPDIGSLLVRADCEGDRRLIADGSGCVQGAAAVYLTYQVIKFAYKCGKIVRSTDSFGRKCLQTTSAALSGAVRGVIAYDVGTMAGNIRSVFRDSFPERADSASSDTILAGQILNRTVIAHYATPLLVDILKELSRRNPFARS